MLNESKKKCQRYWKRWKESGAVGILQFNQNKHPEILPDEVFISNTDIRDFYSIGWKTKRRGSIAIDWLGQPLGSRWPRSFPVFAKKSELEKEGVLHTAIHRDRKSVLVS